MGDSVEMKKMLEKPLGHSSESRMNIIQYQRLGAMCEKLCPVFAHLLFLRVVVSLPS